MRPAALVLCVLCGCGLEERADFLVGRGCLPGNARCDPGEACLPHQLNGTMLGDYRCRNRASFDPVQGREPPLAYCDEAQGLVCPGDLVCNADRVRQDTSVRPLVCKRPDDVFSPPLDAGS